MKNSIFLIGILSLFLVTSCQKDEIITPEEIEAVREYASVNKLFNEAGNAGDDAVDNAEQNPSNRLLSRNSNSPIITVDPADSTTFPKTITVDFGTGFTGPDGVNRKGKLIIISTAWRNVLGSVHTMTFDNYYQNDHKIEGTHIETNIGTQTNDRIFTVEIQDGKVTTPIGAIINYTQNTTRATIEGTDTPFDIWDNAYEITGTQSGISSNNITYSISVSEALKFRAVPRGFYEGVALLNIGNTNDIILNYNNNTVTINGNSYPL